MKIGFLAVAFLLLLTIPGTAAQPVLDQTDGIATIGTNQGTLAGTEDSFIFLFTVEVVAGYKFSLTGPAGTDFDIYIVDAEENILGSAIDVSYPDEVTVALGEGDYNIVVVSFEGSGQFTLEISKTASPTSFIFWDGFVSGDFMSWEGTYSDSSVSVGLQIDVEVLEDAPAVDADTVDPQFRITSYQDGEQTDTVDSFDPLIYILPVAVGLDDNTTGNLEFILTELAYLGDFDVLIDDGLVTVEIVQGVEYLRLIYDETTGILLSYEANTQSALVSLELTESSVAVGSPQAQLTEIFYYIGFDRDDVIVWEGTVTDSTETTDIEIEIEIVADLLFVDEDTVNPLFVVSIFENGVVSEVEAVVDPGLFLLPVSFTYENGSVGGMADFAALVFPGAEITEFEDTIIIDFFGSGSFLEITYDAETGILIDYSLREQGFEFVLELVESPITSETSTTETSDTSESPGFGLHVGIFASACIAIIRKVKANQ